MKKLIFIVLVLVFSANLFTYSVLAQQDGIGIIALPPEVDGSADALSNFLGMFSNAIFVVGGLGLLGYLLYGGIKLQTAGGDQKMMAAAKGTITSAIVGFILLTVGLATSLIMGYWMPFNAAPGMTDIYICGSGELGPLQPGTVCTDPSQCPRCARPSYRISNQAFANITMAPGYIPGTICTSSAQCDSLCATNASVQEYRFCRPPNRVR